MGKEIRAIIIGAFTSVIIHLAILFLPISLPHVAEVRNIAGPMEVSLVVQQPASIPKSPPKAPEQKGITGAVPDKIKAPELKVEALVKRTRSVADARLGAAQADATKGKTPIKPVSQKMKAAELKGEAFVRQTQPMTEARIRIPRIRASGDSLQQKSQGRRSPTPGGLKNGEVGAVDTERAYRRGTPTFAIPRYKLNPKPPYPTVARRRGYEGTVRLEVEVLTTGMVGWIKVKQSSGYEVLDRCALGTVKKWRFIPASLDGVPVTSAVVVPITFRLKH